MKNHLGEGPHYESSTGVLRWVDIIRKEIHTVNVEEGPKSHKVVQFEDPIGYVSAPQARGNIVTLLNGLLVLLPI